MSKFVYKLGGCNMATITQVTLIVCVTIVILVAMSGVSEYLKDNKEE